MRLTAIALVTDVVDHFGTLRPVGSRVESIGNAGDVLVGLEKVRGAGQEQAGPQRRGSDTCTWEQQYVPVKNVEIQV